LTENLAYAFPFEVMVMEERESRREKGRVKGTWGRVKESDMF
jgi:hypothetical protein